jgi:hypothetical protein
LALFERQNHYQYLFAPNAYFGGYLALALPLSDLRDLSDITDSFLYFLEQSHDIIITYLFLIRGIQQWADGGSITCLDGCQYLVGHRDGWMFCRRFFFLPATLVTADVDTDGNGKK